MWRFSEPIYVYSLLEAYGGSSERLGPALCRAISTSPTIQETSGCGVELNLYTPVCFGAPLGARNGTPSVRLRRWCRSVSAEDGEVLP